MAGKKCSWCLSGFEKYKAYAPLILRLALGIAFIVAGYTKLSNMSMVVEMFSQFFGGAGPALAWIVAIVELIAGIAVLVGFFTRWAALAIAVIMLVALFVVHLGDGYNGMQLPIAYFAMSLALLFKGSGKVSVECDLMKK